MPAAEPGWLIFTKVLCIGNSVNCQAASNRARRQITSFKKPLRLSIFTTGSPLARADRLPGRVL
jgi:hypothetical protein